MSNRLDQEREAQLQPLRMQSCKEKLEAMGYVVQTFGDDRLEFTYKGNVIRLWPYSGWHTGRGIKDGRGFNKLLKQLERPE